MHLFTSFSYFLLPLSTLPFFIHLKYFISHISFFHCFAHFYFFSFCLSPFLLSVYPPLPFSWPLLTDSFWRQQCKSLSGSSGTAVPLSSPAQPSLWWTQAPPEWPHCRQKAKFTLGIGSGLHQTRYKTWIKYKILIFYLSFSLLHPQTCFILFFSGTVNPCSIDSCISVILPIFKYSSVFSLNVFLFLLLIFIVSYFLQL